MPKLYDKGRNAVIAFVHNLENRTDIAARFAQHDEDEHIWALRRYTLEEIGIFGADPQKYPSITLNGPRTFYNAMRRSLTASPPRIRIDLPSISALSTSDPGLTPEQRLEADEENYARQLRETTRHERFALGLLQDVDEVRIRRDMQPLQLDMAWSFCVRGGAIARVWLDPDLTHPLSTALWDPRTCVWEPGAEGLSLMAHHYWTPQYDVVERYDLDAEKAGRLKQDSHGNVEVYDCWWAEGGKVYNGVFTPDMDLKPAEAMPKTDHLPIYVVRAFGPDIEGNYRSGNNQSDRTVKAWESIYTANKDTYKQLNRIATLYGLYLRNNAIGPYAGRLGIESKEEAMKALEPFAYNEMPPDGEMPQPITPAQMADPIREFNAMLTAREQQASVPASTFGQLPFQLSGFAVNQLQGAVSITAGQIATQMGWLYKLIIDEAFQQFRARGKKISVRGSDQRRRQFMEDFKRSDIRDKYTLEVTVTPELPQDRLQEAQVAQAWGSLGIDPITIADEILHLDDPREVLERMAAWARLQAEIAPKAQPQQPQQPQQSFNAPGVDGNVPPTPQADTGAVPQDVRVPNNGGY